MAGVLFRVYIPTSQHETRLRENLKNKLRPSPDTCEVNIDNNNVRIANKEETDRHFFKVNELSNAPTDISDKSNKDSNSNESKSPSPKPKPKEEGKKTKSLEDIPLKGSDLAVEFEEISLEKALKKVLKNMNIVNAMWCKTEDTNYFQVMFGMEADSACEEVLQQLQEYGIGCKWTSVVSVIPCSLYYRSVDDDAVDDAAAEGLAQGDEQKETAEMSEWDNFLASIRSRLTVAEVVQGVKAGASLTFDFIALLLVAGFLSALGLVENSTVVLVASMLISPLMGPILAGTFGTMIADRHLQKMGIRNELLGLLTCLIIGFLFGSVIGISTDKWGDGEWPTEEMTSRGKVRSLWVGLLIALFSGAGVAISTLADYTGSLVGVAISASLLPPAVNAGLLWGLACMDLITGRDVNQDNNTATLSYSWVYSTHRPSDLAILGTVSMGLTLLNILCIFIMGILVLKVKAVAPRTTTEQQRFWKHDVKVAKDYNWTWNGEDARELGRRLLVERSGRSFDGPVGQRRGSLEKLNPLTDGTQMTWSPNMRDAHSREFPSVQELEVLYRTFANAKRTTPPRLFLRQMSEVSRRTLGTPTSPPPQLNFGPPVFSANASLETVPEDRAVMSLEPPRRPQRLRNARFIVSPAEEP